MKAPHQALRAPALLVLAAALTMAAPRPARAADHAFEAGECSSCHPSQPDEAPGAPPSLRARIHAQCLTCHAPCDVGRRHATEELVAPQATQLPFDNAGAVDCRTCHFTHAAPAANPSGWRKLRVGNTRRELCLACHRERTPGHLRVVSPPPAVTVCGPETLLAGTVEVTPGLEIFVRRNGTTYPLPLKEGTFSTWISLEEGVNRLAIVADRIVLWETEVFRPAAAAAETTAYRRLHRGHLTGRGECDDCHDGAAGERGTIAVPTAAALCYRCHDRFEGKRYVHGPVAVGSCLSCHDPHGGVGLAALVEEPSTLCLSCHERGDVSHCVTDTRDGSPPCTSCHDPHESDARYFRRGEDPRPGALLR